MAPGPNLFGLPIRADIFVNLGAAPLRCSRVRVWTFCNQGRIPRSSTTYSKQKTRTLNCGGCGTQFHHYDKIARFWQGKRRNLAISDTVKSLKLEPDSSIRSSNGGLSTSPSALPV